jgi:hypothetical protein
VWRRQSRESGKIKKNTCTDEDFMKIIPEIGIQIPSILLPKPGIDLTKWAVIACDQYTSEPEYWKGVDQFVGDAPSTYHLILPEVFLGASEETARVQSTQNAMQSYLQSGLFATHEGFILVERTCGDRTRHGVMLALDLEKYDYHQGSQTLIRATEGTILDRLPPRIKIRADASLELPHILVLIDDPGYTVIEPLLEYRDHLPQLYDFDLNLDSGHLAGYLINQPELEGQVVKALQKLADPLTFRTKYKVSDQDKPLLFAMGDGNHSLATAKAIWEKIKAEVGMDHPARYALVEIENVHSAGLIFEPIHRVLFDINEDVHQAMKRYYGEDLLFVSCPNLNALQSAVNRQEQAGQTVGIVSGRSFELAIFKRPLSNLPVGTLQPFIDRWLKNGGAAKVDYVHGEDVVARLGAQPGNLGFVLPGMLKSDLFKTVILDGALPRKTFSMGEAREKRFYMECRKIA